MRRPLVLALPTALLVVLAGCGDEQADPRAPLVCETYAEENANFLISNSDTGERNVEGEIVGSYRVYDAGVEYISLNVDGEIVAVARASSGGTASLDTASEAATNFPVNEQIGSISDPGAEKAIECARSGDAGAESQEGFDVEAWRQEVIDTFGPEVVNPDGSKDDYVEMARSYCVNGTRTPPPGSLGEFVLETFCPYVP